jgi:glycosyltransferase involved in cell wall biosynthesis
MQLVGAPGEERLRLWYRAADVFVLPPDPHEGIGMATLEALASGTPAVAAPVGANPELLTPLEPRLLARSARSVDLAAAIGEALELTGPPLRQRCADYASERFAWQQVIETWEDELVETARSAE